MSIEQANEDHISRKAGRQIDMSENVSSVKPEKRQGKTFIPNQDEALQEVPEAITAGESLPHISEYSGISLEALPVKGLKSFLYGFGVLVTVLISWEVVAVLKSALEIHWLLAGSFALLLVLVSGLALRALRSYLSDQESLESLGNMQKKSSRLKGVHDVGNGSVFINELKQFYIDKPQFVYLQRCVDTLPDYSNDREVIAHIDRAFLQPLDKEALRRISSFSLQTGAAVAVSPWASLDMLLSLWRSIKMIDDVAQVYGLRPSLANRYRLLRLVIHQLAFVGASEIVIDQLVDEFGSSTLTSIASARVGQGLGAGIYTARIGIAAMKVSRPIEFSKDNQPKTKSIIRPMIEKIKGLMGG